MNVTAIIALAVAIPIVLFPVAFVWYLNIGAALKARQEARKPAPELNR